MPTPPLSVIVPIFNTATYLRECLNSLKSQTLINIEVILIDDGSTDGSSEIVDEYGKLYPETFHVIHQRNSGQSLARNAGLDIATGEYIGFVDSDDVVLPEMFEKLYLIAVADDLDHASCDYCGYVDGKDVGDRRFVGLAHGGNDNGVEGLYGRLTVAPPLHIWKRELLNRCGIRFSSAHAYEDVAFYYEAIAYVTSTRYLNEALYFRRWREGSLMTSTSYPGVIGFLDTVYSILSFYADRRISLDKTMNMQAALLRIMLLSHMARCVSLPMKNEASDAISQTISFIKVEFPPRWSLKLDNGLIGLYLRYCPMALVPMIARIRMKITKMKSDLQ